MVATRISKIFNPIRGFSRSNLTGLIFQLGCFNHHLDMFEFFGGFFFDPSLWVCQNGGTETEKRNSATSAITSGPVWTWKHEGAGKKQQQKHATIHTTLTTSGANVQQKTGAEVLSWFFFRWRLFYRGCYGGEMNRIVFCFFRNPFFNGRLHCKEIVKRWSICSFFKHAT